MTLDIKMTMTEILYHCRRLRNPLQSSILVALPGNGCLAMVACQWLPVNDCLAIIAWQWLPVSARMMLMTACDQLDFQTSCQERGPGVLGGERAAATNAAAHAISRLTHGCQGSRCHSGPENTKTCSEISIPNSRCHLVFYACHCHQSTNRSGSSVSKLATSEA